MGFATDICNIHLFKGELSFSLISTLLVAFRYPTGFRPSLKSSVRPPPRKVGVVAYPFVIGGGHTLCRKHSPCCVDKTWDPKGCDFCSYLLCQARMEINEHKAHQPCRDHLKKWVSGFTKSYGGEVITDPSLRELLTLGCNPRTAFEDRSDF